MLVETRKTNAIKENYKYITVSVNTAVPCNAVNLRKTNESILPAYL